VFLHVNGGGLCAQKAPLEIGSDHTIPLVFRHLEQWLPRLDSGVVDKDVHATEARNGRVDHRSHVRRDADVALDSEGIDAEGPNLCDRVVRKIGGRMVINRDIAPCPREFKRDSLADTSITPGDQRSAAFQSH
jgi:hypothetical protein